MQDTFSVHRQEMGGPKFAIGRLFCRLRPMAVAGVQGDGDSAGLGVEVRKVKHTHIFKLARRTITFAIEELPDRVAISFLSDKYGEFGDEKEVMAALLPLIEKYDTDPRPTVMVNPLTGEHATIYGNATHSVAIIRKGRP